MIQFAEVFPEEQIVVALIRQLSWSHFRLLIPIKDADKRDFYAEMCRVERWNVRMLQKKIDSMLFERTALSKKPEKLVRHEIDNLRKEDLLTPDLVFKDPYVLEFLNLDDHYLEKDLEDAIMRELEQFLFCMRSVGVPKIGISSMFRLKIGQKVVLFYPFSPILLLEH